MWYTYILHWNKYYIWSTTDLIRRISEHKDWKNYSTKRIWEWKLVFVKKFELILEARRFELKLKKSWHPERWIDSLENEVNQYMGC